MKIAFAIVPILATAGLTHLGLGAEASARSDVQFSDQAPHSTGTEIQRRLGIRDAPPTYNLANEKFQVILPAAETNSVWGLFIWVSPNPSTKVPSDWLPELAKHHLIFAGAYGAGNDRHPIDRFRLALDAAFNLQHQYTIDTNRVYVAGFSGGGRVASMLGVSYADVFTGTLNICGVNFYTSIPVGGGQYYPASYTADPRFLPIAKRRGRFVLLTGEQDMNRENTKSVYEQGFRRNGFANVRYLEVAGMKHAVPTAKVLEVALDFLDGKTTSTNLPAIKP